MTNDLIKALIAAGAVCLAVPAAAQDAASMTCEDFMAMDAEGQQESMTMMQEESMASGTTSTTGTGTGTTATTGTGTTTTAGTGTGTTATTGTGTGTTTTTADATATTDTDAMMEEQMASVMAACEQDPSMMVMDAMNMDG